MVTGIYDNDFSRVFSYLLEKYKVSCYQISQYCNLDQAYLSRLKSGEKKNPSPGTIFKIALSLTHLSEKITMYDIEELFKSVGRSLFVKWFLILYK